MSDNPPNENHRSFAERFTLSVSIAIVAGIAALVVVIAVNRGGGPPLIEATALIERTRVEADAFVLPIDVTNRGDQTAANVLIEVELTIPDQSPETAEFEIAFLPADGTEQGTVVFRSDPAAGDLTVTVRSYPRP